MRVYTRRRESDIKTRDGRKVVSRSRFRVISFWRFGKNLFGMLCERNKFRA